MTPWNKAPEVQIIKEVSIAIIELCKSKGYAPGEALAGMAAAAAFIISTHEHRNPSNTTLLETYLEGVRCLATQAPTAPPAATDAWS